jgi:hypothetical protein
MEEQTKLDTLALRIDQYKEAIQKEIQGFVTQHNYYLDLIEQTGINDPEADPILLGPAALARVRQWYSFARKEAYSISAKSRDLMKFYIAVADQGKANQYELVRLKQYSPDMHTSTDAKEIARRIGGRLEEKAAYFEGEYLRWQGIGDSYEQVAHSIKDMFELAQYEWQLTKVRP